MSIKDDVNEAAEELLEASRLCNDECGEWFAALAALVPRYRDAASDDFATALETEILLEYRRWQEEFRIEEEVVTEKRTYRTVKHFTEP